MLPELYLLGAATYFAATFTVFEQETDLSFEDVRLSWIVLMVATILWPICVPISYLELIYVNRNLWTRR